MNTDDLQTAIDVLKMRIRSKEEDINRLKRTVNEMCADAGQDVPYADIGNSDAGNNASIRSDQFYGQTISSAAKTYLEMRRSQGAASVNDIFAALKNGGFKFETKDDGNAKNGLRISLRKNSSIFHRLPGGAYGLLAWYPNAKPPKDDDEAGEDAPQASAAVPAANSPAASGRFASMKQMDAIVQCVKELQPCKTRAVYEALIKGGMKLAKASYVTSLFARAKDKFARNDKGLWILKPQ
jgi:hypothetical protein